MDVFFAWQELREEKNLVDLEKSEATMLGYNEKKFINKINIHIFVISHSM